MIKLLLLLSIFLLDGSTIDIKRGEWICFFTDAKEQECGTYGISKSRKLAYQYGIDKCAEECENSCKLDYCEKIK